MNMNDNHQIPPEYEVARRYELKSTVIVIWNSPILAARTISSKPARKVKI